MHRFIPRGAVALPALLIALGTSAAVAIPAQAASTWSAPVSLPAGVGSGGFAVNASGEQIAVTGPGPQVSSSTNGTTWSAPVTIGQGGSGGAVALAANGRAVVVWQGGTASAPVLQASTQATPGGAWSAPVTIGANASDQPPVIGIDASGNAIIAWAGATGPKTLGPVYTASLPAGGTWTAETALTASGSSVVRLAVNATGSAIVTWATDNEIVADSGTILGGFSAPVNVGAALGYHDLPRVSFVALNNAGQAAVAYTPQSAIGMAALRSANGTWGGATALPCGFAGNVAIDGAGDVTVLCDGSTTNAEGESVTTLEATRLAAGGSTWGTPVLLTSDFVIGESIAADAAGTFVVAWGDVATVNNVGVETVDAVTSAPGGGFGAATKFPVTTLGSFGLTVAPGRATLVWNSSTGAFESTEPVS